MVTLDEAGADDVDQDLGRSHGASVRPGFGRARAGVSSLTRSDESGGVARTVTRCQLAFASSCKQDGGMATLESLGEFLKDQRRGAQLTLRQLADQTGVSNPYLSQIERGLRKPSAEVLQQLAKGLRISAETLYVRAGILDPDEHDGTVGRAGRTLRHRPHRAPEARAARHLRVVPARERAAPPRA